MRFSNSLLTIAVLTIASVSPSSAQTWQSGFGQGIAEYSVRNTNGDQFMLTCDDAGRGDGPGALITIHGDGPRTEGIVQLYIDGQDLQLTFNDDGSLNTDCRACDGNWNAIWPALRGGSNLTVVFPDGRSAAFPLRGSSAALPAEICRSQLARSFE